MLNEAAEAGQYKYSDKCYDRIQLLTVADILEQRKGFDTPTKMGSKVGPGQIALALQ